MMSESGAAKHVPRSAHLDEAERIHALLWAARDEIPLVAKFASSDYVDWVRRECKNRRFWVVEIETEIAGVMQLVDNYIGYLVTAERFRKLRRGWQRL